MKATITITTDISASLSFNEDDIINNIGKELYNSKKSQNPGGIFKAWVLAHEGTSNVNLVAKKKKVSIEWGKDAIVAAYNKIKNGLKFYHKHNNKAILTDDNSGRKELGEIVGKARRNIDGKESLIAIGYFPPESKDRATKSNIVSMEAMWTFAEKAGKLIAESIDDIKQIAMGSTESGATPGFDGAHELAQVTAYNEQEGTTMTEQAPQRAEIDYDQLSFPDLKRLCRKFRVFPTQLFDAEELVGKRIITESGEAVYDGGDRDLQDYIEKKLVSPYNNKLTQLETDLKESKTMNQGLNQTIALNNAVPRIREIAGELKLSDQMLSYAESNIDKLQIGDNADDSYKEFIQTQVTEYENKAKFFVQQSAGTKDSPSFGDKPKSDGKNPFMEQD